jgi:hypothetical protein
MEPTTIAVSRSLISLGVDSSANATVAIMLATTKKITLLISHLLNL